MSLYKDASLVMIPSAYKDGKLYSIRPIPEYGTELVTNGGFDTDTAWTKGTGWTISGGTANCNGTNDTAIEQNISSSNTTLKRITFSVSNYVSGTLRVYSGSGADVFLNVSANGTYELESYLINNKIFIYSLSSFNGSVDNISVKEVIKGDGDFTFSRGSNLAATRVDVNGLIEKGRENLLLQSNQFDTTWTDSGANVSVTSGQSGYDGSDDSWLLDIDYTGGDGYLRQEKSISGVNTFSIYAKSGTTDGIYIEFAAGNFPNIKVDLSDGTLISTNGTIATNIENVGSGWYRVSLSVNQSLARVNIRAVNGSGTNTTGTIYIQDAQLEQGLVATDYIETGASTAQAGILEDMPRLDYSGSCPSLLLEPQRTNILAYSEGMFDSSNFTQVNGISVEGQQTDLNGTNTAVKLSNFVQSAARLDYNTAVAAVDGKTYTYSAYYKGSGDIRINVSTSTGVGGAGEKTITLTDEWVRHSITTTFSSPTGNVKSHLAITRTANNDAEVYMCFAQIEEGSYPTSYIPTYGTSQTRSDDFMNISSLADEIDGNSFTYFLEVNNDAVVRDASTGNISVGATGNRFFLYNSNATSNRLQLFIQDSGGIEQYVLSADNVKLAIRFEPNKVEVFENGVSVKSTTQNLDFSGNSSYVLRGTTREIGVKQTAIFPTPLTDSECIALTTL